MRKCSVKCFKCISLIIIVSFLGLQSCVDLSSVPDQNTNQSNTKIQIYSPLSNSTISEGDNTIIYSVTKPYSLKFIELYINDVFAKNIPPTTAGTLPAVNINIDSSDIGKTMDIFLIFYDNNGTSFKSNTITSLRVSKDNRIPFKPYNISLINFTNGSCNISWKDSSHYVKNYELWRKIDFNGQYILYQELSGNSFNTNDYGLDSNKIYFYKLRGVKDSGVSDFSDEVNTAGIISSGDLYAASNLTATISGASVITLNWKDNSNNENYFSVERSTGVLNFSSIAILNRNTTAYKDSGNGLLIGTTYNYRIKSYSNIDSAISNTITIRLTSNILQPPSNLTANFDSTIVVIKLEWQNNDSNILFFDIERRTENTNFTGIKRIDSGNSLYLDFNIVRNQVYTYRIRGYDLNSYSDYSDEVTISTY